MISLNIPTVNLKSYVSESECISILKQKSKKQPTLLGPLERANLSQWTT
jgi:hypothetical protein